MASNYRASVSFFERFDRPWYVGRRCKDESCRVSSLRKLKRTERHLWSLTEHLKPDGRDQVETGLVWMVDSESDSLFGLLKDRSHGVGIKV